MSMQYMGWVRMTPSGGSAISVPISRCGLDVRPNPIIMEDTIQGGKAGNPNANPVSAINYAQGKVKFNGDIAFPLFDAHADEVFDMAIGSRDSFHKIEVFDGMLFYEYTYTKVGRMTLGGNADGRLDCTLTLEALGRSRTTAPATPAFVTTATLGINLAPIPFWKTTFTVLDGVTSVVLPKHVTAWQVVANNNLFILSSASGSRLPDDIQCGLQTCEGSFTYYPVTGWPPSAAPSELSQMDENDPQTDGSGGSVNIGSPKEGMKATIVVGSKTITVPQLLFTGYSRELSNPNTKPMRACTFRGFGDATHGAVYTN